MPHAQTNRQRKRLAIGAIAARGLGSLGQAGRFLLTAGPLRLVRFLGPVGMLVGAVLGTAAATQTEERLHAGRGFLLAGQAFAVMSNRAGLATTLGIVAGGAQIGLGAWQALGGIRSRSRPATVSGLLDVAGGTAWVLASMSIAAPWSTGVFAVAAVAKVAYVNQDTLRRFGSRALAVVRSWRTASSLAARAN